MSEGTYTPRYPIRVVTASSLFDGHDAAINIIRRLLQASGAEVIHLGHSRSAREIVNCAVQEDANAIAISSYQGGHMEFFQYVVELLASFGASHIKVFGGGGGVITTDEVAKMQAFGVERIYSAEDGRAMGLGGMIDDLLARSDFDAREAAACPSTPAASDYRSVACAISAVENSPEEQRENSPAVQSRPPVIGITGTGGAGKSTLTDELLRRFLRDFPHRKFAVIAVDPTRRRTGGALLGDRIRMNSAVDERVYMRSMATRDSASELSPAVRGAVEITCAAGFDLVLIETPGIGQGGSAIADVANISVYVMTADFGAPTQLEKIDMLDFADLVAINKLDRQQSRDALRHVRKQYQRNHARFGDPLEAMPVYGTVASNFNDGGTDRLYEALIGLINARSNSKWALSSPQTTSSTFGIGSSSVPAERSDYLAKIVTSIREYRDSVRGASESARAIQHTSAVRDRMAGAGADTADIDHYLEALQAGADSAAAGMIDGWHHTASTYAGRHGSDRDRETGPSTDLEGTTLSELDVARVALPHFSDHGDLVRWLMTENLPGYFPFTAGVFPFRRTTEDPKRQFAGIGGPERTNNRFHYLSRDDKFKRLSTAFDPVTLYGEDPDFRPDIYGRIGESGVNVCTVDDMSRLYSGFDLCSPSTSVSLTINGPAPVLLAMYFNTAIDQQRALFTRTNAREPDAAEDAHIQDVTLASLRGTVQADILKEVQAQNECIFSTEFAMRLMGDVQQYFVDHKIRNYYSVSVSGFHIAEAGANPVTQLAFTLANAFTYVEYYVSRGMHIDDFAPNFSFFFSNGMDAEYAVIGRVARRIWAIVVRNVYGGNERSQKLKYHIQTSGRSLHAMEVGFNDIRTTLQALLALQDNCNSLHTNAYDEAITTPTEESLRRAIAIQLIISREYGIQKCENVLQGSFAIEQLTDLMEEAVLVELARLNERGGVMAAMETQYQRGKIQDESLDYETKKHSGELPIIGVNTFIAATTDAKDGVSDRLERATDEEKRLQVDRLNEFKAAHASEAARLLGELRDAASSGSNTFEVLMRAVRHCSLGQLTNALYEAGGSTGAIRKLPFVAMEWAVLKGQAVSR